jgi:aromatic-L-amino-acid/L-tryptophan decarboxylase
MSINLKKIKELEEVSRLLEGTVMQRSAWTKVTQSYIFNFVADTIASKTKVWQTRKTDAPVISSVPIEENGKSIIKVLDHYKDFVDSSGINPASGGHLGYIPGGGLYLASLGDYLAAATNKYAGIHYSNPGAVELENQLIRWMCKLIGFPDTALGNLASGGSIANLIAITTARDVKEITSKKVDTSVIYLTQQVHHCIQKALRIAGLGEAIIRYIPTDERYRMNAIAFAQQIEKDKLEGLNPFMVVGSAGTTDVGAVDPLSIIAMIAEKHNIWFHVDAAYGGFFMLVDDMKDKFNGIERADSVVIDPHKGLFLPYGLGAVLMKDVDAQRRSHYYKANYMQDADNDEEYSPADLSPELSKHFRGLRMWLPLQLFGLKPFRAALEEKLVLCNYFYAEIQKIGFEVGPEPDLSVCIYRFVPQNGEDANAFNANLVEIVKNDGRVFVSSTTIDGVYWIRLAVLSFRTHKEHIDVLLSIFRDAVK